LSVKTQARTRFWLDLTILEMGLLGARAAGERDCTAALAIIT